MIRAGAQSGCSFLGRRALGPGHRAQVAYEPIIPLSFVAEDVLLNISFTALVPLKFLHSQR